MTLTRLMPAFAILILGFGQTVAAQDQFPEDPQSTRLMIGPTARSLKQDEAYIEALDLFLPGVQVGITDHISVGAGTVLLVPGGDPGEAVWFTPKIQIYSGTKTQAAVGVIEGTEKGKIFGGGAGIAYAVVTHGSPDASVTVGLGAAYRRGSDADGECAVLLVAGEKRLNRRLKLIAENYVAQGGGGDLNVGFRVIRGPRVATDLGLTYILGVNAAPIPFARFTFKFSDR